MNDEQLKLLQDDYYHQIPIEYANRTGRRGYQHMTESWMSNIAPGVPLIEYLIGVAEKDPQHRWAARHLRDRLVSYLAGFEPLDKALGVKRLVDPRRWASRMMRDPVTGLSMRARIVASVQYRHPLDETTFEQVAEQIEEGHRRWQKSPPRPFPRISGASVRRIYYESKDDPAVLDEIQEFWTQLRKNAASKKRDDAE
jgi:hypothetical protein